MKKGDVVRLKIHSHKKFNLAAYSEESWEYAQAIAEEDVPKEFVVERVYPEMYCGGKHAALVLEGIPGNFNSRYFETVLEAGEPDVDQLMKESTDLRREIITSPWGVII